MLPADVSGRERVAAAKTGLPVGGEFLGTLTKAGTLGRTRPEVCGRSANNKVAWHEKSEMLLAVVRMAVKDGSPRRQNQVLRALMTTSLWRLMVVRTDLLVSICMKISGGVSDKRVAEGRNIRDERNSGCDPTRPWQACVKLVSPDCNAVTMDHMKEKIRYTSQQGGRRQTEQVDQVCGTLNKLQGSPRDLLSLHAMWTCA